MNNFIYNKIRAVTSSSLTDVDIDGNSGNIVDIGHLSGEFTNE